MKGLNLTGQKYNRLTALYFTGKKTKRGHNNIWMCVCDCGSLVEVDTASLRSGATKSCGCYTRDRMAQLNKTHGGRNERLYLVWMDMRRRCNDPKDANYKFYGARGISVCKEWEDYAVFREWACQSGYDKTAKRAKCTLDRIDVNKGYCPENCRWVDMVIQQNNKRSNLYITYNGKTQTAAQWEREIGLPRCVVAKRIRRGWSIERALSTMDGRNRKQSNVAKLNLSGQAV